MEVARLKLLVHILCELKDSHGITAEKLCEAGQDVRRQITPASRLEVLDEIYFVRQMEEQFIDGEIGKPPGLKYSFLRIGLIKYRCKHFDSSFPHAAPGFRQPGWREGVIKSDKSGHCVGPASGATVASY